MTWRAILLCFVFLLTGLHAASPPRFTANYYLMEPQKWAKQEVTLYIAQLLPGEKTEMSVPKGFRALGAETVYQGEYGGKMTLLVKDTRYKSLVQRIGTVIDADVRVSNGVGKLKVESKSIKGLYYQHEGQWVLIIK